MDIYKHKYYKLAVFLTYIISKMNNDYVIMITKSYWNNTI